MSPAHLLMVKNFTDASVGSPGKVWCHDSLQAPVAPETIHSAAEVQSV